MAKYTTLGEITTNFLLNDFDVYVMNTSATGGYTSTDWTLLGFTGQEKNINRIQEKYEKEGKIPRVIQYTKTIRKGLELTFDLSNQNSEIIAEMTQATSVSLGATGAELDHGTTEATKVYKAFRLASTLDDGTVYTITIPKTDFILNGEQTVGGETETVLPTMLKAVYNPAAAATKNLYYEQFLASGVSATSDVGIAF